ncbi:uncharacterized protein LOC131614056 [Vicia villosa]|uniref:uncharacterized protein LOC131614056 n=1 Tax=Vicia villosa TaxID=3911 RepID=UPI00273AB550|nr:uncharacterized protein LOC131614056 [Vicia villosa]
MGLDDYRPICLVGCLYKVIAKLLASRIKIVLKSIISPCQNAFVPGRQLLDGVVVANEVVDFAKKEGRNYILFKVDFEKAYDKVGWSFLRYMFKRMGFREKWQKWMELLVFSSNMSVLVNGSPTKEFKVTKGLRQGDPLSPFLFVLVVEGLTGLVKNSMLLLEDSNFYFLGIPVGYNPRKEASWNPLLKKMRNRMEGWTNRFLNLGGRITLLKSVLSSLCIFTMSFYKMPKKVVRKFTSIQSRFLWGGVEDRRWRILQDQNSLWCKVLKSRYGDLSSKALGMNIEVNVSNSSSVWWKDILKIHSSSSSSSSSSLCDPIVECGRFIIRYGFNTPFWHATWLGDKPLLEEFSDLFIVSRLKYVSVTAMGGWVEELWRWGDLGLPGDVVEDPVLSVQFLSLKERLEAFKGWEIGRDTVVWSGNLEREFSVASCFDLYEKSNTPYGPPINHMEAFGLLWKTEVPFKIKAFGWRLFHNRLHLKDLLVIRGMSFPLEDLKWPFCGLYEESRDHSFFGCLVVGNIWREIAFWVGKGDFF